VLVHLRVQTREGERFHDCLGVGTQWAREVSVSYYRGRVAVITGAGSGIGRALALDLAARGARIALLDQDAGTVGETARRCKNAGTQVRADTVDVTDRPALASWAESVLRQFGHVDLVICAAGVIHTGSLLTSEPGDVDRVINVNVLGVFSTVKLFLPHLASGGHIVTFSSGFGLVGAPLYTAYCASKFAVRGLSEALGLEMALGGHPVSVTCVIPGGIRTPIMRKGSFAADVDAAAVIAGFNGRVARMDPDRAASVILRGVQRRRPRVLVGVDARGVSAVARSAASTYQYLGSSLLRRRRRKESGR
jgi:NAD(P)-dependent dehydrogenase (short-subunit alcohol dehydrogenase family)